MVLGVNGQPASQRLFPGRSVERAAHCAAADFAGGDDGGPRAFGPATPAVAITVGAAPTWYDAAVVNRTGNIGERVT